MDYLKAHAEIPVVLDPVLVCKESHDVEVSALRDIDQILPLCDYHHAKLTRS